MSRDRVSVFVATASLALLGVLAAIGLGMATSPEFVFGTEPCVTGTAVDLSCYQPPIGAIAVVTLTFVSVLLLLQPEINAAIGSVVGADE